MESEKHTASGPGWRALCLTIVAGVFFCASPTEAAAATLYVDNPGDYIITNDTGVAGLSCGDTVTWAPVADSQHGGEVAGLVYCTNAFGTIQAAVNAASAGDTIRVGPGTFSELVTVNKQLSMLGNQVGIDARTRTGVPETVVNGGDLGGGVHSTSFNITASDVVLDGFTTQDTTSGNLFAFGILLSPGTAGSKVRNNIIQNNIAGLSLANNSATNQTIIERNQFRNNNQPGLVSGSGIYSDQFNAGGTLTNVLIDNNSFVGHSGQGIFFSSTDAAQPATGITISNNLFSGNGRALVVFNLTSSSITSNTIQNSTDSATADLRLFEGVNGLTITNNVLQNGAGRALRITNAGTGAPNTTNVSFNFNSIAGYVGPAGTFQLDSGGYTGTLNATQNWWNDITGPTTTANPGGTGVTLSDPDGVVDFQPWLVYAPDATAGTAGVQFVTSFTITAQTTTLTATNNNYRRLVNVIESLRSGQTVNLVGTFDWTEANAAASWALGNDGVSSNFDDYSLLVPANLNNVTLTANNLGDATIQGPGDLASVNLEGVLMFDGGDNQNWTISNLRFLDFDLSIGMFVGAGGSDAFNNTHITNNHIRIARDLNATVAPADVSQNIGIHFSFGANQVISGNTLEIQGDGVSNSAGGDVASDVGMQSNVSGGSVYDGLLITNNIIRVLNAQSGDPERILGIWENAHGHTSNINISGNQFLNEAAGNNPATNLQRAFRVTSHSSATTTVTYQNNTVSGANIGFEWLAASNFGGNQPVKLTSNTITNNATGVLVQSQGLADLSFNRIVGNSVAGATNLDGTLKAENNWWGCNAGPGNTGCNGVSITVDFNPWLVLGISAAPGTVITGGTSTATADMTHNSNNAVPSSAIFVPSTGITFGATLGTMAPPTGTLSSGQATSVFTSTSAGNGVASATVDNQTVSTPIIVISPANVTGTKTVSGTFAPGGVITYTVALSNSSPAAQLNNPGNEFTDVLPLGVTLISATATGGTAVATIGTNTVTWNGSIPAGSSIVINITATINNNAGGTTISNQGTISYDGDGNGTNESSRLTDDPAVAGASDPTSFSVSKGSQTITFSALGNKAFGDPDFTVSATATSGLAVSFAASGQCTVSGNTVHITSAGSCTITASQAGNSNFNAAADVLQSFTIANRALITLSQSNYNVNESTGFVTITVNRTGDLSIPVSVDYATEDTGSSNVCNTLNSGMASSRCDFGSTLGTLRFGATETQKTFLIPITQDSYTEGSELLTVNLSNLTGSNVAFATPSSATVTINDSPAPAPNANDDTDAFVRQHYRDFLNREADPAGLAFWTNEITSCGNDAACREIKRINVSAAFFLSIEFQTTGNLVRNFYVAALDRPLTNNMPAFVEFQRDTQGVQRGVTVGQGNWQQTLNDNRDAFMRDFVTRTEFVGLYPTTDTPAQYVDKLFLHAGITPTVVERDAAIAEFGSATTAADAGARGRALLRVTQSAVFVQREANRSFVQMQYLGYLRRNPNDAPDNSFAGFDFWLAKLNQFNGDAIAAEMIKAFITSAEYRARFGP